MNNCLFCKIIKKEIPSQIVYQDEFVTGFKDISPLAHVHVLFVHKNHSNNINFMAPSEITDIYRAIAKFTIDEKLDLEGFRVVTNAGPNSGQTVFHTHFHVLGGQKLGGFGA